MAGEDLEARHHLCQGDAAVLLPVLHRLFGVDEDDEVLVLALMVDFDLRCVASDHGDGCGGCFEVRGVIEFDMLSWWGLEVRVVEQEIGIGVGLVRVWSVGVCEVD